MTVIFVTVAGKSLCDSGRGVDSVMAESAIGLNGAVSERRRALILPREHGAWGILLVPLVTGAAVGLQAGGPFYPVLLFTTAVVALFWLRTPLESWFGTSPDVPRPHRSGNWFGASSCLWLWLSQPL